MQPRGGLSLSERRGGLALPAPGGHAEKAGPGLGPPPEAHGASTLLWDLPPLDPGGRSCTRRSAVFCVAPKGTPTRRGKPRELQTKNICLKNFSYRLLKINATF